MLVLVVDDSLTMRLSLRMLLGRLGCDCVDAVDGQDALGQLEAGLRPGLCLVDWSMPGLDGLGLLRALKERGLPEAGKVLMVTGDDDLDHIRLALEAGALEYLMKPVTPEALRDKLNTLGYDLELDGGAGPC